MPRKLALVVEDQKPIAMLLRRLAEHCGARTAVAYDGEQALELMRQEQPDLVLLDLKMPIMNGQEVLAIMEGDANLKEVPVVIVSAVENIEEILTSDVPHLEKPFVPADLERIIREKLAGDCAAK